jgi:hypothetical protein
MTARPVSFLLALCPILALAACQAVGPAPGTAGARSLTAAETSNASQVALTAAAADRCAVPNNARRMLDRLMAQAPGAQRHNDTLAVYNEVFEGLRRTFATDRAFCSPERLARTREDVARYGG